MFTTADTAASAMAAPTHPLCAETLQLRRGQQLQRIAAAGLCLTVECGELLLTEPPGDALLGLQGLRRQLRTGQGHVVGQPGWLRLEARSDCRLHWRPT